MARETALHPSYVGVASDGLTGVDSMDVRVGASKSSAHAKTHQTWASEQNAN